MSFLFRYSPFFGLAACVAYPFFAVDLSVEMFWTLFAVALVFLVAGIAVACREPLPAHFVNFDPLKEVRHYNSAGYMYDSSNPLSRAYVDSKIVLFDRD